MNVLEDADISGLRNKPAEHVQTANNRGQNVEHSENRKERRKVSVAAADVIPDKMLC